LEGVHQAASDFVPDSDVNGVSEAPISLQPIGNPISHSRWLGLIFPDTHTPRFFAAFRELLPPAESLLLAVGVG
jgi:hypothetical protein